MVKLKNKPEISDCPLPSNGYEGTGTSCPVNQIPGRFDLDFVSVIFKKSTELLGFLYLNLEYAWVNHPKGIKFMAVEIN